MMLTSTSGILRAGCRSSIRLMRQNSTLPKVLVDQRSPVEIATSSVLKQESPTNKAPVIPKKKRPLLSDSKFEDANFKMPQYMQSLGELVISVFRLDMDRIRAGPVAGSVYYAECKKQGLQFENEPLSNTAKFYYNDLNLPRTFSQWFQITALHEWMLFVRMRAMPFKYGRNYQQKLIDRFFRDMELRLADEMGINSSRISDQYLKDYNAQMRGLVCSYDEGFITDDITLAQALWRNLFNGEKNIDFAHLEAVVKYVRENLYILSKMSDRDFAFGRFRFVEPDLVVHRLTKKQEEDMIKSSREIYEPKDRKLLPSEKSIFSFEN